MRIHCECLPLYQLGPAEWIRARNWPSERKRKRAKWKGNPEHWIYSANENRMKSIHFSWYLAMFVWFLFRCDLCKRHCVRVCVCYYLRHFNVFTFYFCRLIDWLKSGGGFVRAHSWAAYFWKIWLYVFTLRKCEGVPQRQHKWFAARIVNVSVVDIGNFGALINKRALRR